MEAMAGFIPPGFHGVILPVPALRADDQSQSPRIRKDSSSITAKNWR
ncbi:hypothetical protein [Paenibacillus sp. MSJ-34]|nr:hypothetical protein [Paenibacillus sp. MSJ-34]MBU5444976.1 hypothetical protein [Paenibacillus sp. MSJ-34]